MDRIEIKSSNIKSVGYDEDSQVLEIEFQNGGIYQYTDVPQEEYERLMDAESIGKHFYAFIRNNYEFKKVNNEEN